MVNMEALEIFVYFFGVQQKSRNCVNFSKLLNKLRQYHIKALSLGKF